MSKFTIVKNPAADDIVKKDLDIIIAELTVKLGKYIKSIYLIGGFGRGEGAVIEKDGMFFPLNDYDIEIIPKPMYRKQVIKGIKNISKSLDTKVSVKQVDLNVISAIKLFIPFNGVKRYDLKNGHQLLWGKNTVINSFSSKRIPLIEGTKYYTNRMGGLLIAYLLLEGAGNFDNKARAELIYLELNKAKLAIGDSLLIKNKLYNYSYIKRKKIIQSLNGKDRNNDKTIKLYVEAMNERFNTKEKQKALSDLRKEWFKIAPIFLTSLLEFESFFRGEVFKDTEDYVEYFKTYKPTFITKLKAFANNEYSKSTNITRCNFLSILSCLIQNDKYSEERLKREYKNMDIIEILKVVLLKWHPAGIVGEIC